jgi:YcaO-like protein with predicted kinase domain
MGITRVANVTGLDCIGIPVTTVCRPNSRSLSVSQGKGATLDAAQTSGLMEAVELFHAENVALPLRFCSYEELRYSHRVVDPEALPRVSGSLFHADLKLLWCEGRELFGPSLDGPSVLVPLEMVHTDDTQRLPGGACFPAGSNGLASGNYMLEAISHGLCEVVERDATTLWRLSDIAVQDRCRLDPRTIDDAGCSELLDAFTRAGAAVGIWEITSDVGIPAFACFLAPRQPGIMRHEAYARGYGCHPSRAVALSRALTEAAQSRLTVISGSRDDIKREDFQLLQDPDNVARTRDRIMQPEFPRDFREVADFDASTLEDDVGWEIERLRTAGFGQVIAVDLTKPEFGIPVVHVIVPGLESNIRPRYAPGKRARAVLMPDSEVGQPQ